MNTYMRHSKSGTASTYGMGFLHQDYPVPQGSLGTQPPLQVILWVHKLSWRAYTVPSKLSFGSELPTM